MRGALLGSEKITPAGALGIGQAAPYEVVNFMRDDVDEVRRMGQQIGIENDFAASEKARRNDFFTGSGAIEQLTAMGPQVTGELDV